MFITATAQQWPTFEAEMMTIKKYVKRTILGNYGMLKLIIATFTVYLLYEEFYVFLIEKPTYTSSGKLDTGIQEYLLN